MRLLLNPINVAQWVLIGLGTTVLANTGHSAWIWPLIILVVGMHFLPLARLFANPLYYVTGVSMTLLALSYPFLSPRARAIRPDAL